MYRIEKADYGIRFELSGVIGPEEMAGWLAEFKTSVDNLSGGFCVFVDMRTLKPMSPEAQESVQRGQKYARAKGMIRSVVILNNVVTAFQFRRIAEETGIFLYERYLDAETEPDWEKVGLAWLQEGIDPDARWKH